MEPESGREGGERRRWVFVFRVEGDLRFISHHDMLRLFRRALARANVPVRFSEGFNPHPRISLPLPRPVGMASDAESLTIETVSDIDPDGTLARLALHTPDDLQMVSVRRHESKATLQPVSVTYRLDVDGLPAPDDGVHDWNSKVVRLLAAEKLDVERRNAKTGVFRRIDVRPYIEDLRAQDGAVEFTLHVTGSGTAKPSEIATLLGYKGMPVNQCIRRIAVKYQ